MGADIKSLRTRIKSVDSTLHLTKAMGLVASSKMRRANEAMSQSRQYAAALEDTMNALCVSPECRKSPYMNKHEGVTRLIVIAGDRGLAGGYNNNIFRLLRDYPDAQIIAIGKRACERYAQSVVSSETFSAEDARHLAAEQCAAFAAGDFARLGIVYTEYISMMTQNARIEWVLPLESAAETRAVGTVFEPDERAILDAAVPLYVAGRLIAALRESFASEVAARRMAMDSAGKNAQTMIDELQLEYNRARQSAITQEITEIVAGAGE